MAQAAEQGTHPGAPLGRNVPLGQVDTQVVPCSSSFPVHVRHSVARGPVQVAHELSHRMHCTPERSAWRPARQARHTASGWAVSQAMQPASAHGRQSADPTNAGPMPSGHVRTHSPEGLRSQPPMHWMHSDAEGPMQPAHAAWQSWHWPGTPAGRKRFPTQLGHFPASVVAARQGTHWRPSFARAKPSRHWATQAPDWRTAPPEQAAHRPGRVAEQAAQPAPGQAAHRAGDTGMPVDSSATGR